MRSDEVVSRCVADCQVRLHCPAESPRKVTDRTPVDRVVQGEMAMSVDEQIVGSSPN